MEAQAKSQDADSRPSGVKVELDRHVAVVELCAPPHNFIHLDLLADIADALESLDRDADCRAIVLAAEGRSFCAGADFSRAGSGTAPTLSAVLAQIRRLFHTSKPIVAAVHGPAIGAGMGLALVADFRVASAETRFAASFNRVGLHPGLGLSLTLPRLVGQQQAAKLLYTGERIDGVEAARIGLADVLCAADGVRQAALQFAIEIATSAPLAVQATRATLRMGLTGEIDAILLRESQQQERDFATSDFKEGAAAMAARRPPIFQGR